MGFNIIGNLGDSNNVASLGQFAYGTGRDFVRSVIGPSDRVTFAIKQGNDSEPSTFVTFDCSLNETYVYDAQPTGVPIESGETITDHVNQSPIEISITGIVSDTPLGGTQGAAKGLADLATQGIVSVANNVAGPLGVLAAGAGFLAINSTVNTERPSHSALIKILQLMYGNKTAKPPIPPTVFRVTTDLGVYDNMVIKTLTVPRDSTTGNALIFNVTLTQLQIVSAQTLTFEVAQIKTISDTKRATVEQEGAVYRETQRSFNRGVKIGEGQ